MIPAQTLAPLQLWGLEEAHNYPPSGAPHSTQPCVVLAPHLPELDELLGKLEEVLTLFLFRSYVLIFTFLSVENSVEGSWG